MPSFTATYTNVLGLTRKIKLSASDSAGAKRNLRRRGISPNTLTLTDATKTEAVKVSSTDSKKSSLFTMDLGAAFEKVPGVKDKAIFATKLGAMVDAGVPIVRSLDLMANQQKLPMFKRALSEISSDVNQGASLGSSMRKFPKIFDRLFVAMVEAGEAGGVLDETLRRLSILLENIAKLQNQIKGALSYPIAVFVIAIGVFLGMTIFVIPQFADIFKQLGAELPAFTQALVDLSTLLRSTFSFFLVGGIVLAAWLFLRFYATPVGRRKVDAITLKIPLFGDLIQKSSTAQFCRVYSSLSRAGVPILLCLEIVQETSGNSIIADAIGASRKDVQEGINLSTSLNRKNVFPDMAMSMLAIGEETGEMDKMLTKVADFYEDEVTATTKALTALIEPFMIVIVGGMVASILVAMYLPMFAVFDKIR
ncbi:type II secretion system F family protein [Cyanobium sp. Morenito 9A2]|uniref:type II secretion system F family protein n=1 Tax=Cyanobium sp. Morenito 9A2 TaxID=2823718 RepID=UPI0020CE538D|nr:type II secretion system F family protein [Cyanobium sp. Morenito 9A2]MCP9850300.1 type II secretion system F family protein [Cyanobium sp. Morenito 9A2]